MRGNNRRMIKFVSKFLKSEKGSTLVLVALLIPVFIGACALVIDIGRVTLEKQRLQNAIDAACLAGAKDLPDTDTATSTAYSYIRLNGYNDSDISTPTFSNSNYTINISGSKSVDYTIAKVLGFKDSINVHPSAAATKEGVGPAFGYAIFSGNKDVSLDLSNKIDVVGGKVHSNSSISLPEKYSIPMGCEAVKGYSDTINKANFVNMPDLLSLITTGQTIDGDWSYDGRPIDGGIYVKGNLVIKSGDIIGNGCIIATGTITYIGSGAYAQAGSGVCLCSLSTEGITLDGSGGDLYGIVYAPNGPIRFNGSKAVVHGRLIADTIRLNGAKVSVISDSSDLNLPDEGPVKLTK